MSDLKEAIERHYAALAGGESCCDSSKLSCCSPPAKQLDGWRLDEAPASESGLGCGFPLKYAGLHAGEVVLDLGSGAGAEVLAAARQVKPQGRAIGVDMTAEMVEAARARAARTGITNAEFLQGSIEALPLDASSVDVIISNCVINLVPEKEKAFREMFRVLKPGGRFVVSDLVTRGSVPSSWQRDSELWARCVAGAIEMERYLRLIGEAGFQDIVVCAQTAGRAFSRPDFTLLSITVAGNRPARILDRLDQQ